MKKKLPFFVYGTLLEGQPNFEPFFGGLNVKVQPARLLDHVLLAPYRARFPYMTSVESLPASTKKAYEHFTPSVIGQIITVPDNKYDQVLENLDYLEGVSFNHYDRVEVRPRITVGDKQVMVDAYAYRLPAKDVAAFFHDPIIAHGSWEKFRNDRT